MRCWRKSVALSLVFDFLLMGCVAALPPLPPVPREPVEKLRSTITAMSEGGEKVEVPPQVEGKPPAAIECKQSKQDPALWLCRGDPERMGKGQGLFFAFEGSAQGLQQLLATERLLRQLVPVLQQRIEVRDRMLLAMLDLLDTMTVVADEYRTIAVIRGEEITRLQRDRIIDRFTLVIPVFGLAAGIVYVLVR